MTKGQVQSAMASAPFATCMKTILMVFNIIFWITGIAILALGIWTKVQLYMYMELSEDYYKEAPYVLIGVGAVIVIVGSLGCCCTAKGNACLLYMYAGFLMIVFVAELSAGVSGFVYKGKLEKGFQDGLNKALEKYGNPKFATKSEAVDGLQRALHCCGISSYEDWFTSPWSRKAGKGNSVPKSCCRVNEDVCKNTNLPAKAGNRTELDVHETGCHTLVVEFMNGNLALIGGIALGVSFFQVFGAIIACCLAKSINKSKYEQVA